MLRTVALIATAGLFLVGVMYLFFPAGHSRILGFILLTLSTLIIVRTMDRWVKVLPVILGIMILNGLLMLVTGHLLNNSSIKISRSGLLIIMVLFVCNYLLSSGFTNRKLTFLDRAALLVFVFTLAWWIAYDTSNTVPSGTLNIREFIVIGVGSLSLLSAWALHERRQPRHKPEA